MRQRLPNPARDGECIVAEHRAEMWCDGLPPLSVGEFARGASVVHGCLPSRRVVGHGEHVGEGLIHLDVVETDAIERRQLVLVLAQIPGAKNRARRGEIVQPWVTQSMRVIALSDVPQRLLPCLSSDGLVEPLVRGCRRTICHELEEFELSGHVAVQGHRADSDLVGQAPHRQRRHALGVGEFDGPFDHRLEGGAGTPDLRVRAPQKVEKAQRICVVRRLRHRHPFRCPMVLVRTYRTLYGWRVVQPSGEEVHMSVDEIRVRGARQNNLHNIDVDLAKRRLIVVVGVSGSGKSSFVFDTLAAEAQRQINSTYSAYAQNYLPSYGRPDADLIENLSAAVVVEQRRLIGGPRSTVATLTDLGDWMRMVYARAATPHLGRSQAFSFNDPAGMCLTCHGLGREEDVDVAAFVDETRSLREGPFRHPDYKAGSPALRRYISSGLFDADVPLEQFSARERHLLLDAEAGEVETFGAHDVPSSYEGVIVRFKRVQLAKNAAQLKGEAKKAYERLVTEQPCTECAGTRLNEAARSASIDGVTLPEAYARSASELSDVMRGWNLDALDGVVAEIVTHLERLCDLGIGYLSLDRSTATLSCGEAQRLRMVGHLGSTLNDMLYIFDEPTTGLHARDVERLSKTLTALRDKGNTVVVVEHNPSVMAIADEVIEIGPGAGSRGGEVVFQGTYRELVETETPTGRAIRARHSVERTSRTPRGVVKIEHASSHNLRDVSVDIPLGVLTVVTGVAGSGKSTLIRGHLPQVAPDAVLIDQGPIRGSRRSTPASWTGMLDDIRRIFAKATKQPAGLFSPNSDGGCRDCGGTGLTFIELGFADSVTITCETCAGRRFRPGALRHTVGGLSIADVFDLTVDEALSHFEDARLVRLLTSLSRVGLGYVALGQNLTTLSGGERQRLKLARELTADASLIVLDEPTTGLHPADTGRLLELLQQLVDDGRTLVVIEHDLDVIAAADHLIDLGPDGGHDGGVVQFVGTVPEIVETNTHTGVYLRRHLQR